MWHHRNQRAGMSVKTMMTLDGWSGRIPSTYSASTDEERAVDAAMRICRNGGTK
jgi:hypothetical protein